MRVRNITGLRVPDTVRPGDVFEFTGKLSVVVTGIASDLIDVTTYGGDAKFLPGDVFADIIGDWRES